MKLRYSKRDLPSSALRAPSPRERGEGDAVRSRPLPFSPFTGRRWPEGPDEGRFRRTIAQSIKLSTILLALFATPAAATEPKPAEPTSAPSPTEEIRRFCTNIADAAKDRRYALQTAELEKLQADIDERMKALEAKRAEYEDWLTRREAFLAQAESGVVKIYATMRPDAAAERLAELRLELAAGILMKLDSRKAGVILNEMERKAAAALTGVMAAAARKTDPT